MASRHPCLRPGSVCAPRFNSSTRHRPVPSELPLGLPFLNEGEARDFGSSPRARGRLARGRRKTGGIFHGGLLLAPGRAWPPARVAEPPPMGTRRPGARRRVQLRRRASGPSSLGSKRARISCAAGGPKSALHLSGAPGPKQSPATYFATRMVRAASCRPGW